jgi:type VI secretion system protein ImpK
MQDAIANFVHPVFNQGLHLLQLVKRREPLEFRVKQAELIRLLSPDGSRNYPDFVGDDTGFLGIRYALACWLDEIFIFDSPWSQLWRENALERSLFRSNIGGEEFWRQFDQARGRPGTDAAEVYYLCVMLGFRGEARDNPELLRQRVDGARARIAQMQAREPDMPPPRPLPNYLDPLTGRDEFHRMVKIFGVLVLLLLPFVLVSLLRLWT